jgi:hypothetical protein
VFDRAKGGWALVLAALQALGHELDMSYSRPGIVPIGRKARTTNIRVGPSLGGQVTTGPL